MLKSKLKNKKGFTMVELLAVIVILGILSVISIASVQGIIAKAKDRYYKSQEDNMIMATQSYLKNNNKKQPKVNGQIVKITLNELLKAKYIDQVVDYKKEVCNGSTSYVKVFRYEDQDYYTPYLECPNHNTDLTEYEGEIDISASFAGDGQHLGDAAVTINILDKNKDGIAGAPTGIVSYQYKIYVDKKLKYTSDRFNVKKSATVAKTISLKEYTPGMVKISVTATNIYGNTKTKTFSQSYEDKTKPTCGDVEGASTTWVNGTRTITVNCEDDGVGCERDSYTYEFTGDVKVGEIKIKDKSGNEEKCKVNVYLDNTAPEIDLKVYKKKVGSNAKEGSVMNSKKTKTNAELTVNKNNVGGWLNNANWPGGVYFELDFSDVSSVTKVEWKWNDKNLKSSSTNVTTLTQTKTDTPGKANGTLTNTLVDEGYRYGTVTATDVLGNTSSIVVRVPMDRTAPTITPSGDSTSWTGSNRTVNVNCSDAISGCATANNSTNYDYTIKTKGFTYKDNAGNEASKTVNIYVDKTKPSCGTITGASTSWSKSDRTIKVKCNDSDSGCSQTEFSKLFNSNIQVGQVTLSDKVGNTTNCNVNAYIDKTPPTVNTTARNADNNNLTIDLSDNIALVGYAIQTSETTPSSWIAINNSKTFNKTLTQNTGTYYIYAKDAAGNISYKKQYVLKMSPPTCSISLSGSTYNGWYTSNVTVKMNTTGTISSKGLATSQNSTNGSTSVTHTYDTSGVTYYGYVSNAAGTASCSKWFKVDKGPSKPSINLNGYGSGSWTNSNVTISAATSSTFNIDRWEYSHDNRSWSTQIQNWSANFGGGKKSINSTINWDGQWTFYVRAVNVNGIASPSSDAFTIRRDTQCPTASSYIECGAHFAGYPNHNAANILILRDEGVGLSSREIWWGDSKFGENHFHGGNAPIGGVEFRDTLGSEGSWSQYKVNVCDALGNCCSHYNKVGYSC